MTPSFLRWTGDETIVVTGGGSGIGAAMSIAAAEQGAHVVIWDVNGEAADAVAREAVDLGYQATANEVDLTDRGAVAEAWAEVASARGRVAALANVAGPPSFGAHDLNEGVRIALDCMRNPTEIWLDAHATESPATVLFASMQGAYHGSGVQWYTVAKSAVHGYMKSLAALRPSGVRANAVLPDWTVTPRTAPHMSSIAPAGVWAGNPMQRMASAQDCATAALFLLSPVSAYLNGVSIEVDGGVRLRSAAWLKSQGVLT